MSGDNTINELWAKLDAEGPGSLVPKDIDDTIAYMRQARRSWEMGQKPKKFEDLKVEAIPDAVKAVLLPTPKIQRRF